VGVSRDGEGVCGFLDGCKCAGFVLNGEKERGEEREEEGKVW